MPKTQPEPRHPHPYVHIKRFKTEKRKGMDLVTLFPESEDDLAESVLNATKDPLVQWIYVEKEPIPGVCF